MIPALPPRRRRLRSLVLPFAAAGALAGSLAYVASIWPAPEPFVVPRDRTPVALVPMTSDAAWTMATDDPRCLLLLEDYLRRPNWQITLTSGSSGCMGDSTSASITLDADGDASWTGGGLPARPLHLTPTQIAALHAVSTTSCDRPQGEDHDYSSGFVDVHWGGRDAPARRVRESPAQAQLDAFVDEAVARYRDRRLDERRDFHATVVVEPYAVIPIRHRMTLTFDAHGKLTIRARGRTVVVPDLDVEAQVDAIDWIELGGPASLPVPRSLVYVIDRATFDAGLQD